MAKYYYPSCVWPTTVKRSSKSPWSSICHTADLVFSRTQYCLGIDALSLFGKIGSMIVVLSVIFLVCFISLVLLVLLLLKRGFMSLRLKIYTLDVILLIMKFRNGYLRLLFCLLANFIWCMILGDGLLTPHLCLL